MEQKIIDFIKMNCDEVEGETPIYYLTSGKKFTHENKVFELLFMGVYQTLEENPKEVVQFLGIELDEDGEDTTNEVFFSYGELTDEVQDKILDEIVKTTIHTIISK